jgi:Predicted transcriptional regulator, consists of a Zn-ribbon and ATP-cone domains
MVDEIEAELQQRAVREVNSTEIGELVLQNLRDLSEVAYIRFASVYRKFQGIRDFVDTLNHLQSTSGRSSSQGTVAQEESPVSSDTTILTPSQPVSRAEV